MIVIENEKELFSINGGTNLNSSFINAIVNGAKIILELGRSLGSAIRRSSSGKICE